MEQYKKNLGKVSITCEGVWDINKDYERLSIVYEKDKIKSYISKIDVPQGISLEDETYWMPIRLSGATEYTINNNVGFNDYPIFDETKEYNIGDIIVYNNILYKFIKYHAPGIWIKEDVINWTIKEDILDNTVKRYSIYNRSNNVLYRRIEISLFNYQDSAGYGVLMHTRRQHYILSSTSYLANPIEGQLFEIGTAYNDMAIGNGDLHVKLIPIGKNNTIRLYVALEPYSYLSIETAGNLNFYIIAKNVYDSANGIKCISLDFKDLVHKDTLYDIFSKGGFYVGNVSFGDAENEDPVEVENTEIIGYNKDGVPSWGIFPNGQASFTDLFIGDNNKAATQNWVNSQLSTYATNEALNSESDARRASTLSGAQGNADGYSVTWQTSQAGAQTVTIPTFGSLGYESIDDYYNKNGLESFLVDGKLMDSLLTYIEDAIPEGGNVDLSDYVTAEGGTINNAKLTGDVTGNGWSIEGGIANFGEVNTDSLYINGEEVLTSSSLANYVTLDTKQTITGQKTFEEAVFSGMAKFNDSIDFKNGDLCGYDDNKQTWSITYDGGAQFESLVLNKALPITAGGTGADSAVDARNNLGLGVAAICGVTSSISKNNGSLVTSSAVYTTLQNNVVSGGKINLATISALELSAIMATLGDNGIKFYLITDSSSNIPSLDGETTIKIEGLGKLILFGKSDPFGVSVGDILAVTKLQCKIIPLNDAKAASGDFPGADGLETVWDKTQINKIAGIETTANAALPKTSLLPSSGAINNMNDALETGVYPWCILGRPSGATGAFTCIVHRSSTPDFNGFYTIEQTAYGREAELGQIYKRIIFWRSDEQQYGEWVRVDNTGGNVDLSNYMKYSVIDSQYPLEVKVDNLDYVEFNSVGAEDIMFKNGFLLEHREEDGLYYDDSKLLTENNYSTILNDAYVTLDTEQTVTGSKTFEGVATFSNTVDVKKQLTVDGGDDEDYNNVTAATFKGYYGKLNIEFDSDNWAIIEKQNDNDGNSVLRIVSGDEISIQSKRIYLWGDEIYANNNAIVTGVKINGSTKTPSDGVVDLGSYAQPVVIEDNSGEIWYLEHNIGRFPFVQIVNGEGKVVQPTSIKHLNLSITVVEFNEEVYGTAILI